MREAASEHGAVVRATTARLTPPPGPLPASGGGGRGVAGPKLAPTAVRIYTARTRCPGEAMSIDVAAWLCGLGLGQYGSAFASNDIDGEILPELTADDLIGLGVTSIGHRRRLLGASAALRREAPQAVVEAAPR